MQNIGKFSLEADENGLVTLQCDRCSMRFKVDSNYLNTEFSGELCCSICGISNQLNTFYPEEVVEEAKKITLMNAHELINDAFKGFNSKHFKVTTKPINRVNTNLSFTNKDFDMNIITPSCCKKKFGLMAIDITSGFYCPYCGRIVR